MALSAAPVVFAATAALVADEACECPDATLGRACPMHHDGISTDEDPGTCHMRGSCAPADVALLNLAGGASVISRPLDWSQEPVVTGVAPFHFTRVARSDVPDAPPPRG